MSNKVFFVMDIQKDATGRTARKPFPYKNSDELIKNINGVIESCREKDIKVIYIRNELKNNLFYRLFAGRFIKGTEGCEFDSKLNVINDNIFSKTQKNAFTNPSLESFLKQNNIDEIFITGLDAKACVFGTSIGAKNNGYKVSVIRDAVVTFNMDDMPKLLEKYKEKGIQLTSIEEFQKIQ